MPKYRVTSPDGGVFDVDAPDGATEQDAINYVQSQMAPQAALRQEQPAAPAAPKQRAPMTSDELWSGRAQNLLQGMLFNFGDEGLAYFSATLDELTGNQTDVSYDDRVNYYLEKARGIDRRMWDEKPTETFLTQLGGGALSGGAGLARAATGTIGAVAPATGAALRSGTAGLGARAAQGSVASAMGGGIAGAGAGEDAASRLGGATGGAVLGGALGAALPVAGSGLGATGRFLRSMVAPGTVNAGNRADELLGEAVARSGLPAGSGPTQALQSMQSKGVTNAAIGDLSDELTAMTGAVARSPGEGRKIVGDFLRARQEGDPLLGRGGQWSDIFDDVATMVSPNVSARRAAESVVAARAKEAEPLYQKAFQVGVIDSPVLRELADIPAMKRALNNGINLAKQEGALPANFKLSDGGPLDARIWHFAKMGIDDLIGGAKKAGSKTAARSLRTMQERLLKELDQATGGSYETARTAFAGKSALLDALEDGKAILQHSVTAEDIADQLAKLSSKSEQDFFRAGVAQAMRDTVSRVGRKGNSAAVFLNRPDVQMKLRATFGNQGEYENFMSRIMTRDRQYRTYSELQGSPTQGRMKTEGDLEAAIVQGAEGPSLIQAATSGGRAGMVRAALSWLQDASVRGLSEKVRSELARKLTSTDPQEVAETARRIQAAAMRAMARQKNAGARRIGVTQGAVLQPTTAALGRREE